MDNPQETLARLRDALAEVDGEILRLSLERQRLAAEIGAVKVDLGWSTRDFAQEKGARRQDVR